MAVLLFVGKSSISDSKTHREQVLCVEQLVAKVKPLKTERR